MGNGIEHQSLSEELGVDVAVVEELSEPELALVELGYLVAGAVENPQLTDGGRRDMYQLGTGLQTELHTALCTTDIDVLDVRALGEVLHVGGTVEDGVNLIQAESGEVLRDVAVDDEDAGAEELLVRLLEVVEQQVLQSVLGCLLVFTAHHTRNGRSVGIDEFAQHVDAQITRSTGQQHVAQLLALALDEGLYPILLQDGVDA